MIVPADPLPADAGSCPEKNVADVAILVSPATPVIGAPVRLIAATFADEDALALRLDGAEPVIGDAPHWIHRRGVPAATIVRLTPRAAGKIRVVVGREGRGLACAEVRVHSASTTRVPSESSLAGVWPTQRSWDTAEEALYSAWIRELFWAPRDEELAYRALHEVTSAADRNLLHGHLGWSEDDRKTPAGLHLEPDCADTPYFLRAYYAWKRRLPFAFRRCSRGRGSKAPRCGQPTTVPGSVEEPRPQDGKTGELLAVQHFFRRTLAWGVHSGNGRAAHGDDGSDLYAVSLTRRSLRPGTIYADPYGHILVVVELVDPVGQMPGVLYAIDGQPDGSITRKRFWEGNFLWNPDPALGGSGFKAFRPVVIDGGVARSLTDREILAAADYGDASSRQAKLTATEFYDEMESLITPGVRDPFVAQEEAVRALHEAAKVRVTSVENGERFLREHPGVVISMPEGHAIFETTGQWEDFSTPSRDLRMLIAIDVVATFDDKIARRPELYGVGTGEAAQLRRRLADQRQKLLDDPALGFTYTRSDGSTHPITLTELVRRARALEIAYNPNDCPEVRWGAPDESAELRTCNRRAPPEQQRKMAAYRMWFRERRRPPRGDPGPPLQ